MPYTAPKEDIKTVASKEPSRSPLAPPQPKAGIPEDVQEMSVQFTAAKDGSTALTGPWCFTCHLSFSGPGVSVKTLHWILPTLQKAKKVRQHLPLLDFILALTRKAWTLLMDTDSES